MTRIRDAREVHPRGGVDRRSFIAGAAAALAAPALISSRSARAAEFVLAKTEHGILQGLRANGAVSFKGVNYAADTGGANRFMAPQPVKGWSGVRPAFEFGDRSMQSGRAGARTDWFAWVNEGTGYSENCCVLNVYSPDLDTTARRPVLLWLHGGGFGGGGSGNPGLDGTALAKFGEVVVVTINHRLNVLGYLNLGYLDPHFADAANAGQLDIVAALKWVRNNIASFGGNPNQVTVFGQSGGGSKIAALMTMPEAKGLFHRAINMSGVSGYGIGPAQDRQPLTDQFLRNLGVTRDNLRQLQTLPYQTLFDAHALAQRALAMDDFRPVIDGVHIIHGPLTPQGLALSEDIPMIVGTTETEATLWLAANPVNLTLTAKQLQDRIAAQFTFRSAQAEKVIRGYRQDRPDRTPYELLSAAASDAMFRGRMLRAVSQRVDSGKAPVYLYNFTWRVPVDGGIWLSPHACDIPFAFGNLEIANVMTGNDPAASEVAANMMSAFVAFARTGNPDNPRIPNWAPYNTRSRPTLVINKHCEMVNDYLGADRVASQAILSQESFQLTAGPLFTGKI